MAGWRERLRARVFGGRCPYCGRAIERFVLVDRPEGYYSDISVPCFGGNILAMRRVWFQPVLHLWPCPCGRLTLQRWVHVIQGDTGQSPELVESALGPNPPDAPFDPTDLVPLTEGERPKKKKKGA